MKPLSQSQPLNWENVNSIRVVTRMRGYSSPIVTIKNNKILPESSNQKSHQINSPKLFNIFTSNPKCNKVIVTKEAIKEHLIATSLKSAKDLEDINKTIINKAILYEFDNVYTEKENITHLYEGEMNSKIKQMFNGYSTCVFAMGPYHSGKTFTLFGEKTEKQKGLIELSLIDLFNLIDISKQSAKNYYGIYTSYVISIQIYNVYQKNIDVLEEEVMLESLNDFYHLVGNVTHLRKNLINKYREGNLLNKSNLVTIISLYQKNEDHSKRVSINGVFHEKSGDFIQCISKCGFIELVDSNYGFAPSNSPNTKLFGNTAKTFNDLDNLFVCLSQNTHPRFSTTLFNSINCPNNNNNKPLLNVGTNLLLILCVSPCDPHIKKFKNILIWGNCLRNKLSKQMVNSSKKQTEEKKESLGGSKYTFCSDNSKTTPMNSMKITMSEKKDKTSLQSGETFQSELRLSQEKRKVINHKKINTNKFEKPEQKSEEENVNKEEDIKNLKVAFDELTENYSQLYHEHSKALQEIEYMKNEHKKEIQNLKETIYKLTEEIELIKNKNSQIPNQNIDNDNDITKNEAQNDKHSAINKKDGKLKFISDFRNKINKIRSDNMLKKYTYDLPLKESPDTNNKNE